MHQEAGSQPLAGEVGTHEDCVDFLSCSLQPSEPDNARLQLSHHKLLLSDEGSERGRHRCGSPSLNALCGVVSATAAANGACSHRPNVSSIRSICSLTVPLEGRGAVCRVRVERMVSGHFTGGIPKSLHILFASRSSIS